MKLLIRANNKITNCTIEKNENGEIYGVEIEFGKVTRGATLKCG